MIKTKNCGLTLERFSVLNVMDYKLNCINISIRKGLWLVKDYSQTTFLYFHFTIRKEGFFECPHVIKSIVSFRNIHLFAFEDLGG